MGASCVGGFHGVVSFTIHTTPLGPLRHGCACCGAADSSALAAVHPLKFVGTPPSPPLLLLRTRRYWAIGQGTQAFARRNYRRCGCGVQRVAAAPWAFGLGASELGARVRTHTQRSPCPVTYVLLLRDPKERLVSSFYKMGRDIDRTRDLRAFVNWVASSDRCSRWPIPKAEGGRYSLPNAKRSAAHGYFYTTSVREVYQAVVAATAGHRLVVGFTGELGETVQELQRLFGWTRCEVAGTCGKRGTKFKSQPRNTAPRDRHWPGLDAAAEAVAECEVEQFRFLERLRAHANGTRTMSEAVPAHVLFAGRQTRTAQ